MIEEKLKIGSCNAPKESGLVNINVVKARPKDELEKVAAHDSYGRTGRTVEVIIKEKNDIFNIFKKLNNNKYIINSI